MRSNGSGEMPGARDLFSAIDRRDGLNGPDGRVSETLRQGYAGEAYYACLPHFDRPVRLVRPVRHSRQHHQNPLIGHKIPFFLRGTAKPA